MSFPLISFPFISNSKEYCSCIFLDFTLFRARTWSRGGYYSEVDITPPWTHLFTHSIFTSLIWGAGLGAWTLSCSSNSTSVGEPPKRISLPALALSGILRQKIHRCLCFFCVSGANMATFGRSQRANLLRVSLKFSPTFSRRRFLSPIHSQDWIHQFWR